MFDRQCVLCVFIKDLDYSEEGGKCAQGKSESMTAANHPNPLLEGLTVMTMATVYDITILLALSKREKGSLS